MKDEIEKIRSTKFQINLFIDEIMGLMESIDTNDVSQILQLITQNIDFSLLSIEKYTKINILLKVKLILNNSNNFIFNKRNALMRYE